jgi:hypothetical protein
MRARFTIQQRAFVNHPQRQQLLLVIAPRDALAPDRKVRRANDTCIRNSEIESHRRSIKSNGKFYVSLAA